MSEKKLGDDPLAILVTTVSKWIARFISRIITLFLTNIILNIKMSLKLGCHWEPSIKYLRPKGGGERVKAKVYIHSFYDVIPLFKSEEGGRDVWKLPNLSVRTLRMVDLPQYVLLLSGLSHNGYNFLIFLIPILSKLSHCISRFPGWKLFDILFHEISTIN